MRIAFTTLGCKINQYDTDAMQRAAAAEGPVADIAVCIASSMAIARRRPPDDAGRYAYPMQNWILAMLHVEPDIRASMFGYRAALVLLVNGLD